MRKPRLLASLLCAVLMVGYAGGGDESKDGAGEYIPWEGLEPAEPLPSEPNPFTSDGTGTVVDNATDQDGKEFFTITTAEEAVFYLVIDRQWETENVYFMNAMTAADLMALVESSDKPAALEPTPEPDPEPEPTLEPEPVPEKKGGAGQYFKIYRPKHQKVAEPGEDCGGDPYDGPEDYDSEAPWDGDDGGPEE